MYLITNHYIYDQKVWNLDAIVEYSLSPKNNDGLDV